MRILLAAFLIVMAGCSAPADVSPSGSKEGKGGNKGKGGHKNSIPIVYKSPTEFFAGVPDGCQPRTGDDGEPERIAAQKWISANRLGHFVEWETIIDGVTINRSRKEDGMFHVALKSSERGRWGDVITFGETRCWVFPTTNEFLGDLIFDDADTLNYDPVDDKVAKRLRELKGMSVVLRAVVQKAEIYLSGRPNPREQSVTVRLIVSQPIAVSHKNAVVKE
jgi:hypothetical protein